MSCWEVLKIGPTNNERDIKIAYAKLLKQRRPEDDPNSFMELRSSYEQAIKLAKNLKTEGSVNEVSDHVKEENEGDGEIRLQSQIEINPEINNDDRGLYSQVNIIMEDINQLYQEYRKRVDINHWAGILSSIGNAPIQFKEALLLPIAAFFIQNTHVPFMLYEILNKQFEYTNNEQILLEEFGEQATDLLMEKCYLGRFYFDQNIPDDLREEDIDKYLSLRDTLLYDTTINDVDNIVKSLRALAKEDYLVDFALGMRNFYKLEFKKADDLYQKATEKCENQLTLLLQGGYASLRKRDINQAVKIFSGLMEKYSDNPHCIKGLAMCYYHKEKYYEAIILFEVLLEEIPYDFYCKTYRGLCYNKIFQQLRIKPINELSTEERISICKSYRDLRKYHKAYKYIEPIRNKLDAAEKLLLAQISEYVQDVSVEERLENYNDVIKEYEKENINSYEIYEKMAEVYYEDVYREKGDRVGIDKAVEMCNKSIELMPNHAETYYYLSLCYSNGYKDYIKGLEYIDKAIQVDNNIQRYYYTRGRINKILENYKEAIKDFNYIIDQNYCGGSDDDAAFHCAVCYYNLKDYEKTIEYIKDAKRLGCQDDYLDEMEKRIEFSRKPLIIRFFIKFFKILFYRP